MITIAISNNKGGVSKTITSVNCAYCWGLTGRKVLLVDVDGQGNATRSYGILPGNYKVSLYELMLDQIRGMFGKDRIYNVQDAIKRTEYGVDVIPCDGRISEIPIWLLDNAPSDMRASDIKYYWQNNFPYFLRNILNEVSGRYDYIFIDTPPSFEYYTMSALIASDYVIVPVELGDLEITGLEKLVIKISEFQNKYNLNLSILGVLLSRYEARSNVEKALEQQLREHPLFGNYIFKTVIYKNVAIKEASVYMIPAASYKRKKAKDVRDNFDDLLEEVLLWIKQREVAATREM